MHVPSDTFEEVSYHFRSVTYTKSTGMYFFFCMVYIVCFLFVFAIVPLEISVGDCYNVSGISGVVLVTGITLNHKASKYVAVCGFSFF